MAAVLAPDQFDDALACALAPGGLRAVYQPIVRLEDFHVVAHEGLMRLRDRPAPPTLVLDAARRRGRLGELEVVAARTVASGYDYAVADEHLLVNVSVQAILQASARPQELIDALSTAGVDLHRFVIELTERDIVENVVELKAAIGFLRAAGVRLALDDFGMGHSNFELWHELAPEFVKLDRYLVDGVSRSPGRLSIVRALVQIAGELGTDLIAEGIEQQADLEVVRDLGVRYGQGYLLGRPSPEPARRIPEDVLRAASKIRVLPSHALRVGTTRLTAGHLLVDAPSLRADANPQEAEEIFRRHPDLHAIAIVDHDGVPAGLINRRAFNEQLAKPFARELARRRTCAEYMHESPIVCDVDQSVETMVGILCGEDQRYLSDGFIITRERRYCGLGRGESLVRRVTEHRIEAARYANPLTLLPGNIPITEHINRLLAGGRTFWAAYWDLNYFKPFNDEYGYFRGDRMINLVAGTLLRHVQPNWDFLGHVGGDDFVVLFQSEDWMARCSSAIAEFNSAALALFDPADAQRGVLRCEDRSGRIVEFPLTTLSVGVVQVAPGQYQQAESVASDAAAAKRQAKRQGLGLCVLGETVDAAAAT
ncbi:MAG: EAL domain-containing protein [Lysobacter sp.]|nr:EAL domain-containing protein [Lysobacter sp.]